MKTALIIIGVICVLCCGGGIAVFFFGKAAVDKVLTQADTAGDAAISAICTDWDLQALKDHSIPELQAMTAQIENVINVGRENLGPMKSFDGKANLNGIKAENKNGTSYVEVPYNATITCEKGTGTVDLVLVNLNDTGFKIKSINVQANK